MLLKNLLIVAALLPLPVYGAMPLYGSVSTVVENRKGSLVQPSNLIVDDGPVAEELTSTLDSGADSTELFSTPDYEADLIVDEPDPTLVFDGEENLIVDEPASEEQDLADTLLSDEVREE